MGLITRTNINKWCPSHKYYYIDKGYKFTKYGDEYIKINDIKK